MLELRARTGWRGLTDLAESDEPGVAPTTLLELVAGRYRRVRGLSCRATTAWPSVEAVDSVTPRWRRGLSTRVFGAKPADGRRMSRGAPITDAPLVPVPTVIAFVVAVAVAVAVAVVTVLVGASATGPRERRGLGGRFTYDAEAGAPVAPTSRLYVDGIFAFSPPAAAAAVVARGLADRRDTRLLELRARTGWRGLTDLAESDDPCFAVLASFGRTMRPRAGDAARVRTRGLTALCCGTPFLTPPTVRFGFTAMLPGRLITFDVPTDACGTSFVFGGSTTGAGFVLLSPLGRAVGSELVFVSLA